MVFNIKMYRTKIIDHIIKEKCIYITSHKSIIFQEK